MMVRRGLSVAATAGAPEVVLKWKNHKPRNGNTLRYLTWYGVTSGEWVTGVCWAASTNGTVIDYLAICGLPTRSGTRVRTFLIDTRFV